MNQSGRRVVLVVLAFVGVVIAGAGGPLVEPTGSGANVAAAQDDGNAANETTPHRDPRDYRDEGDLEEVEGWLAGQLAGQLRESADELDEGDYGLARELVGDEYRERYDQYADVVNETEGEGRLETFERAREEQERFADAIQTYRERRAEYETARERGDDERARELARELDSLADEINASNHQLQNDYDEISNATGENLTDAETTIAEIHRDIQKEQTTIRRQQFTETDLTIESERASASFRDPFEGRGQLRTAEGEPVANEPIRLRMRSQTIRTETDADGRFDLEYRPTELPLTAEEVTVEYVPDDRSAYLGSETTVPIDVTEQVEPSVTNLAVDDEIAYGEEAAVRGELTADGAPVDNVTLSIRLEDERIGTVRVANGSFAGNATVPADVEDGERDLGVRLAFEERALAAAAANASTTVLETETALSIDAERGEDRNVRVNGTLETADGEGVEGRPVRLRAGGETLDTVTTDDDGAFAGVVTLPASADGEVRVRAVHEGGGSNLEHGEAETTIRLGASTSGIGDPPVRPGVLGALAAAIVVLAVVGFRWYRRGRSDDGTAPSPDRDGPASESGSATPVAGGGPDEAVAASLFERASDHLSSGRPDAAVRTCYGAVRRHLEAQLGPSRSLTHWEFYRRCRGDGSQDREDALRDVTEGFERAAFGAADVSTRDAERVLDRARKLCGFDESNGAPANN